MGVLLLAAGLAVAPFASALAADPPEAQLAAAGAAVAAAEGARARGDAAPALALLQKGRPTRRRPE